uniref:Ig-like domain-containing protein n=1 Tax=Neogobius melanostomus TaxID=47308 RepID=A0A8C6SV50_9GOBI
MRVEGAFVALLTTLATFWSPLRADVSCVFRESCVLPCPFSPETDPMIHWTKEPEYTPVHSYYRNQHLLHLQHESYRNRTSLSDQGIRTADASLQLHKVNVSDEGRYKCYVRTLKLTEFIRVDHVQESLVNLKVYAPVLNVSVSQEGQQLICSSERIYPEPTVAWTPPSSDSYQTQTSVNATEDGLYTVYSSVRLPPNSTAESLTCNISTPYSWRTATVTQAPDNQNLLYLWTLLSLIPIAVAVVCFLKFRNRWKRSRYWNKPLRPEVECAEIPLNDQNMPLEDRKMNHDDKRGVFTELNETSCSVHESTDVTAPTIHI